MVAFAEFFDIKVGFHGVCVDVQGLGEEVLPLLRVVLRLQSVIHDIVRADGHPVSRVCHLVNLRVGKINASILYPVRGTAHKDEILFILHGSVQNLPAVFQPLTKKRLFIIPGGRYADDKLICICLHSLLEQVVLLRLFEGVHFITNGNVAVQRVLRVRVRRQCAYKKRAIFK